MTREEGAYKLVTASLRMQQAAKFVIARLRRSRGNLAVPSGTRESPRQIRCCLPEIAASGLRPPRNDKSEVRAILAMAGTYRQRLQGPLSHLR